MKYEISIFKGWKVMAKVKFFVHAANADADADMDADGRAMTLAPRTFVKFIYQNFNQTRIARKTT